jgi:choline-sulfatase
MKQPNFLFIMADQLSALALGAYGNPIAKTPHIQSLADNGVVFQNAYCNSPLCAPSRASMLTGRLPSQIKAYDNAADFSSSTPTFIHFLRHMGYRTCLAGKMHFTGPDQLHGFEERLTTDIYPADFGWTSDWERPVEDRFSWYHNMQSVTDAGVCVRSNQLDFDETVSHKAVRWIYDQARSDDSRPFCLTVSFTHPHDPYNITQKYWDLYDPEDIDRLYTDPIPFERLDAHSQRVARICNLDPTALTRSQVLNARRAYYGAVSYIDDSVGELMHTLSETGLADDTVIVFTSDHGDMLGDRGLWYKMTFFEWSARVPLIINAPDRFPKQTIHTNVSLLNLFPTLVDIGKNHTSPAFAEGVNNGSLMPYLMGGKKPEATPVVAEYLAEGAVAPCFMVLKDRCKYIFSQTDPPLLFDLEKDPGERMNLVGNPEYQAVENELYDEVENRWDRDQLKRDVIDNQKQRRLVFQAQMQGRHFPWDHQPQEDASQQYMRNHLKLDDLELSRRLLP